MCALGRDVKSFETDTDFARKQNQYTAMKMTSPTATFRTRVDVHTPHPGPLPVEGRGSRRGRKFPFERPSRRPDRRVNWRARTNAMTSAERRRASPSSLNGERAGVRGVPVQLLRFWAPVRKHSARRLFILLVAFF